MYLYFVVIVKSSFIFIIIIIIIIYMQKYFLYGIFPPNISHWFRWIQIQLTLATQVCACALIYTQYLWLLYIILDCLWTVFMSLSLPCIADNATQLPLFNETLI